MRTLRYGSRLFNLRRKLLDFVGFKILKLARWCFWTGRSVRHCWICGAHPGMGPIWAGHMTCDHCCNRWCKYHRPYDCPEMVVDWRGIGRVPKADRAKALARSAAMLCLMLCCSIAFGQTDERL